MALTTTLPTLYEYYGANDITAGLSANQPNFTLNNKEITIYSGAFHYFRVPRPYWRDRLRKMRAAGLNTVATYIPWNLHEPQPGVYDFGNGGSDWEDFLHIQEFLKTAREEDLLVLIRTGPFICAEWEFGGFPSWILRKITSVRTSKDKNYLSLVKTYFNVLLPLLAMFQFQKGGSIIGFQVENEFGSLGVEDSEYLLFLKNLFLQNNITELLYTADAAYNMNKSAIDGVLQMANIAGYKEIVKDLTTVKTLHPLQPLMTMESYTGWFDHWTDYHEENTMNKTEYGNILKEILEYPSSINMYMFVGGTSFGFLNGANTVTDERNNSGLQPTTNSYDYDSPISESGNLTEKYYFIKDIIEQHTTIKTKIPEVPIYKKPVKYPTLNLLGKLYLNELIDDAEQTIDSENIQPMEILPLNNNAGQSYGYIVYRKTNLRISPNSVLKISGYVRDTIMVLLDGKLVSPIPKNATDLCGFGFWTKFNSTLTLTVESEQISTLDLVIENMGRVNYGHISNFIQFKGLTDDVYLNDEKIVGWKIIPLEFKKAWNNKLNDWTNERKQIQGPALYKFELNLNAEPEDTFVDMRNWMKGITIINGFVLGRHFFVGPEQSIYLPAPFLKKGTNDIMVFEHFNIVNNLEFSELPLYQTPFNFTGCSSQNQLVHTNSILDKLPSKISSVLKYFM